MFVRWRHAVSCKLMVFLTVFIEVDDARHSLDDGVLRLLRSSGESLDGLSLGL